MNYAGHEKLRAEVAEIANRTLRAAFRRFSPVATRYIVSGNRLEEQNEREKL